MIPFWIMYLNALSIIPPTQPMFPYWCEQSISCCYERDTLVPCYISNLLYIWEVAANAQQAPQVPCTLTGETALFFLQSTSITSCFFYSVWWKFWKMIWAGAKLTLLSFLPWLPTTKSGAWLTLKVRNFSCISLKLYLEKRLCWALKV